MRLESLELKRVGPFDHLELEFPAGTDPDLADVYLLVGSNGCGKSTVISAIAAAFADAALISSRMHGAPSEVTAKFGLHRATIRRLGASAWMDQPAPHFADGLRVFAYTGARGLDELRAEGLRPLPMLNEYDLRAAHGGRLGDDLLAQWILNKDYEEARALRQHDVSRAAAVGGALRRIERIVEDLTGLSNLRFDVAVDYQVRFVVGGVAHPISVLSDGLKSILSWVADLLMRLDVMSWKSDVPLLERPFLLLLDEIDIHLHPKWQRTLLPCVQRLFPKAQIVASTHSPFVVGSARDARVYPFVTEPLTARSRLMTPQELHLPDGEDSRRGIAALGGVSYRAILSQLFGVESEFDPQTERQLNDLEALKTAVLRREKPIDDLRALANQLAMTSLEVRDIVLTELRSVERQLARPTGTNG